MKIKLAIITLGLLSILSCKKDCPTVTPITIKTPEELLTAKTWKAEEIRTLLSNGTTQYYKRGGSGNSVNYDSDSLKFNVNNTGAYYFSGTQYTTSWNFTNAEKSKMTIIINYPAPLSIFLEHVNLSDNNFTYSQFTATGLTYLASCRRIPN